MGRTLRQGSVVLNETPKRKGSRRALRYTVRAVVIGAAIILGACPRMITDSGYVLTISPAAANVFVNDTTRFTATLRDKNGAAVSTPLSWSVDNTSIAQVDTTGTVHAMTAGSATIRVTGHAEVATAALTVVVDSGQTLTIAPTAASLYVGGSQQFKATLKDHKGNTLSVTPDWQSSNSSVASVNASGMVQAANAGSATIEARARGLMAAASITVLPKPSSVVLVGAGDISTCSNQGDSATAKIIDGISGTVSVFVAGDNAYPDGSAADYANCYDPTWGRFKSRTHPVPGNHEYNIPGASGYFDYFGSAAGDPSKGYYSYDFGAWHVVAINSVITRNAGSAQEQWLRADLAANQKKCTLAYWHYPRFSSGSVHGSDASMQAIWQALYDYDADVVVSGHEHNYERFAPQTPTGQLDNARGIRQFVAGTGGAGNYGFGVTQPNSEVRYNATPGVLKFTLYADHYDWQFIPISGSFTDTGSGSCH